MRTTLALNALSIAKLTWVSLQLSLYVSYSGIVVGYLNSGILQYIIGYNLN